MSRTTKIQLALAGLIATTAVVPGAASGAGAPTKVTIEESAPGDFFGYVKSEETALCAAGRKVAVFKQRGSSPDPANDKKIGSDTAGLVGSRARWDLGNTGLKRGKFYARAARVPGCKAAISETI